MSNGQNHALVWMIYLNRLLQYNNMKFDEHNPRVFLLDTMASAVFVAGRDVKCEPFLGVPVEMMPFFTQVDWVEASICRSKGYLFLEVRDMVSQTLTMAFGIKMRPSRLNVFCLEGKETAELMKMNIKVFEEDGDELLISDQHEMTGLVLKEVASTADLSHDLDAEEARSILENTGVSKSFTSAKAIG